MLAVAFVPPQRVEKQAAPANNPRLWRFYWRYRINDPGNERWVKTSRWAIQGSRLLSPVLVALALGGTLRGYVKRAKAAPLQG